MTIQFLRHATFVLHVNGLKILVDPMLSKKDEMDPVRGAAVDARIPMTELPLDQAALNALVSSIDLVLVTHIHRDHWDVRAQEILPKSFPVICQPGDEKSIRDKGFTDVTACESNLKFKGLNIYRTKGQHGTGDVGNRMGQVSGFVIDNGSKKLYVAGDTIWCADVEEAILTHQPDVIVVNAGAAQFLEGDPITMTADDVLTTCRKAAQSKIIAVHMDTVNHCLLKRNDLKGKLIRADLGDRCVVPDDGQTLLL